MSMDEYFTAIGIKEPLKKRIQELLEKAILLYPDIEFADVAINDYITKDGSRIFDSIRFYSKNITVKIYHFTEKEYKFIVADGTKPIDRVDIEANNYDFVQADDNSRLSIVGKYRNMSFTDLKGSGNNCDYLFAIYKKYIVPRIVSV